MVNSSQQVLFKFFKILAWFGKIGECGQLAIHSWPTHARQVSAKFASLCLDTGLTMMEP